MRRAAAGIAGAMLSGLLALGPALADPAEIRIARQFDLPALPLMVAEHNRLVEKEAAARQLGAIMLHWQPAPDNVVEALERGQVDIAVMPDLVAFIAAWDRSSDASTPVRAIAALSRLPYLLLARNPAITSIRGFTAKDRIAVPSLKLSAPAVLLQMAAAKEWGHEHFDKLDPLMVARKDADAVAAMRSGKGDITAHFARPPFANDELGDPAIHNVTTSFDIIGQHSMGVVVATARFRDANPALCAALVAALDEADRFIRQKPGSAAEIYAEMTHNRDLGVEDLTDMLSDPDIGFAITPSGVEKLAEFLAATGRLKHRPARWQDMFFAEAHGRPGG